MFAMCTPAEKVYTVKGNTSSEIQSMIDKAFSKGGGKVVVPAGLYEVGSIRPESSGKVLVYAYDSHWTMFIRLCRNIEVKGITITADQKMINNDGIDFDGCSHVRVSDSHFKTSDDCRAEGNNGIFADYPTRYLNSDDEGYVDISDIVFDNYSGTFDGSAVQIVSEPGVKIRRADGIEFRNFNVISAGALRFIGNAGHEIGSVLLDNFKAEVLATGEICVVKGCNGLQFKDVTLNGESCPDGLATSLPGDDSELVRSSSVSWEQRGGFDVYKKGRLPIGYFTLTTVGNVTDEKDYKWDFVPFEAVSPCVFGSSAPVPSLSGIRREGVSYRIRDRSRLRDDHIASAFRQTCLDIC